VFSDPYCESKCQECELYQTACRSECECF
jgi:hypothetical protein